MCVCVSACLSVCLCVTIVRTVHPLAKINKRNSTAEAVRVADNLPETSAQNEINCQRLDNLKENKWIYIYGTAICLHFYKRFGKNRSYDSWDTVIFCKWWPWPTFSRSDDKIYFVIGYDSIIVVEILSKLVQTIADISATLWNVTLTMTLIYDVKVIQVICI